MWEEKQNKYEIIAGIILIIIIFVIFPLACCKNNSQPKNLPDYNASHQYDGHL